MKTCQMQTTRGRRCTRPVSASDSRYCAHHSTVFDPTRLFVTALGAAAGNFLVPGFGGIAGGALAGQVLDRVAVASTSSTKRVFLSFDFDSDQGLKHLLVGQAKNKDTPFEFIDGSLIEAAPEDEWEDHAWDAIGASDLLVVLLGEKTHKAPGVLKEVAMARRLGVPRRQLIGYRDKVCRRVDGGGRVHEWSWDVLERLLD